MNKQARIATLTKFFSEQYDMDTALPNSTFSGPTLEGNGSTVDFAALVLPMAFCMDIRNHALYSCCCLFIVLESGEDVKVDIETRLSIPRKQSSGPEHFRGAHAQSPVLVV
jgi:hypothetical protein